MDAWRPTSPLDHIAQWVGRTISIHARLLSGVLLAGLTVGWLAPLWPRLADRDGLVVVVVAVLPVLALMLALQATDKTSKEPLGLLLLTFLAGAAIAVIAAFVNTFLGWLPDAILYTLVVGPGEEALKLLAVVLVAFRSRHFDHAIDGLYYGIAAAAGFAAIENVATAASNDDPWRVLVARMLLSTPSHILWTAVAGYYLGVARFIPQHGATLVAKGLLIAAGSHGLYDLFIMQGGTYGLVAAILLGVVLLLFLMTRMRRFYHVLGPALASRRQAGEDRPEA